MTNQHRATPEQWDSIERCADGSYPYSCILELRARIEALEVGQQPLAFTGKVVAPITRDRDETGNYLIVHDTPAQPEPQGPTDEELLRLACMTDLVYDNGCGAFPCPFMEDTDINREVLSFARAVLARWGTPANNTRGTH
jgi:hypothetical protein